MSTALPSGRRAFWLKHLHSWHWISSALCLIGLLMFSITGITLNHAAQIEASPEVQSREATLPPPLLRALQKAAGEDEPALPVAVTGWLRGELSLVPGSRAPEWSEDEVYLSLPRPGGDAWVSIDLASGAVLSERTDRGWISYLNDLHKGRNTGTWWSWFIDVFALACIVFTITGLLLLQMHARQRPGTWPLVGLGFVVMVVIAMLFIH
jgi:hypothetical protein